MRVRIRRFRSDAGLLPVVKSAPLLMHVGNSLFMEPAVGQGPLDDAVILEAEALREINGPGKAPVPDIGAAGTLPVRLLLSFNDNGY